MTKSDIKSGMTFETRCGSRGMFYVNPNGHLGGREISEGKCGGSYWYASWKDDLKSIYNPEHDIIKVWYPIYTSSLFSFDKKELIWQREPEIQELTISEIEEKLGLQKGSLRIKK